MKYHIYSIIYLTIYMLIYYIPKRMFFFCFYPVAYVLREQAKYIRNGYHFESSSITKIKYNIRYFVKPKFLDLLIWFALDDAPYFHYNKEYNPIKTPKWIPTDFLKSWYWAGFRNNAVNLSRYFSKFQWGGLYIDNYLNLRLFDECIFPKPFYMFKYFKIGFKSKNIFSCRIRKGK